MRRSLLDCARKHRSARRGGPEGRKVLLEDTMAISAHAPLDMIALDVALSRLAQLDPAQAQMVELRFFGGLSVEETAEGLGTSTPTGKPPWASPPPSFFPLTPSRHLTARPLS